MAFAALVAATVWPLSSRIERTTGEPKLLVELGLPEQSSEVVLAHPCQVHHESKNSVDVLPYRITVQQPRDHLIRRAVQVRLEDDERTALLGVLLNQIENARADRRSFVDYDGVAARILRIMAPGRTAIAAVKER